MGKAKNFVSLDDIVPLVEDRTPLSTRVKKKTRLFLEKEAGARKLTVSNLTAAILDSFVTEQLKAKQR